MPGRILIVEDSALVVDAMTVLLESGGHTVRAAGTVAGGIAQCRAGATDVLLLDLSLPDGDGLEVLAAVRDTPHAPAVTAALTGHDDPGTTARCRDAGCREVVLKPFSTRELLARVSAWAEEGAARDA